MPKEYRGYVDQDGDMFRWSIEELVRDQNGDIDEDASRIIATGTAVTMAAAECILNGEWPAGFYMVQMTTTRGSRMYEAIER